MRRYITLLSLQILHLLYYARKIDTFFSIVVSIFCVYYKNIQNLETSQGYFFHILQHFKILSIMQLVHWTTSSLYENTMRSVAQSEANLEQLQWPTWDICQGDTDLEHLKRFKCYFKNWRENLLFNSQATPAWEKSNRKSFK